VYARFRTVLSVGRADIAKRCVPKWGCRASVIRRGSSEHPKDDFPRPCGESGLDMLNRYVVVRGCRGRRRQHRRNPSRCQRSTVAGCTNTSASLHRGHNHRKNSQSRRSARRKRRVERARTPSWWRRARVSSRRSLRVRPADRTAAPIVKPPRIAGRVPSSDPNVNDYCPDAILAKHSYRACNGSRVVPCAS
jgi:hypothetical protein